MPLETEVPPRYRVLETLGEGSQGEVYRALDPELDREVAIKVLSSTTAHEIRSQRLLREAQLVLGIRSPYLFQVYDVGISEGGHAYAVFEFIPGNSLREELSFRGRFSPESARPILEGILEGLDAMHTQGVLHRDLKPANILLARDGTPRIVDFGLAIDEERTRQLTRTGKIVGTPKFMAPELFGGALASVQSDLFSFGSIAYEMLYGRTFRPEREVSDYLKLARMDPVAFLDPARFGEFPAWDPFLQSLLQFHPEDRPGSAGEAKRLLPPRAEGRATEVESLPDATSSLESPRPIPDATPNSNSSSKSKSKSTADSDSPPGFGIPFWLRFTLGFLLAIGVGRLASRGPLPDPPSPVSAPNPRDSRAHLIEAFTRAAARLEPPPEWDAAVLDLDSLAPFLSASLPQKVSRYLVAAEALARTEAASWSQPERDQVRRLSQDAIQSFVLPFYRLNRSATRSSLLFLSSERHLYEAAETLRQRALELEERIRKVFMSSVSHRVVDPIWKKEGWLLFTLGWALLGDFEVPLAKHQSPARALSLHAWSEASRVTFRTAVSQAHHLGWEPLQAWTFLEEACAGAPGDLGLELLPVYWTFLTRAKEGSLPFEPWTKTQALSLEFLKRFDSSQPEHSFLLEELGKKLERDSDGDYLDFDPKVHPPEVFAVLEACRRALETRGISLPREVEAAKDESP